MKSEIFVVSDFNSETVNRLDVPKSGLNLVLTFLLSLANLKGLGHLFTVTAASIRAA